MKNRLFLLGGIFKRLGTFDMSTFNGRLVLQKTIYFLQSFGINLNYAFSLYWYGPYCPELTKEGYELEKHFQETSSIKFVQEKTEKKFAKFIKFLGDKSNDGKKLELLASIHLIKNINPNLTKQEIITRVRNKHSYFDDKKMCLEYWDYLEKFNLL